MWLNSNLSNFLYQSKVCTFVPQLGFPFKLFSLELSTHISRPFLAPTRRGGSISLYPYSSIPALSVVRFLCPIVQLHSTPSLPSSLLRRSNLFLPHNNTTKASLGVVSGSTGWPHGTVNNSLHFERNYFISNSKHSCNMLRVAKQKLIHVGFF